MSRKLLAGLVALGLWGATALPAAAADPLLNELYGSGVHAYNAHRYESAHEFLTEAIDQGSRDPRTFYFRGLVYARTGRPELAEADFKTAADLEITNDAEAFNVGKALERVQGSDRLKIERIRRTARVAALKNDATAAKARYEEVQAREDRVIRKPAGVTAGEAPMLKAPPAGTSPFDNGIGVGNSEKAPDKPAVVAEPAGPAGDPFAKPATTPKPADTSDPFAEKPATDPPAATTRPAAPATDDPFGDPAPATPKAADPPPANPPASDDPFADPADAPATPKAPAAVPPPATPPAADDPFADPADPALAPKAPAADPPATPPAADDPFADPADAGAPKTAAVPPDGGKKGFFGKIFGAAARSVPGPEVPTPEGVAPPVGPAPVAPPAATDPFGDPAPAPATPPAAADPFADPPAAAPPKKVDPAPAADPFADPAPAPKAPETAPPADDPFADPAPAPKAPATPPPAADDPFADPPPAEPKPAEPKPADDPFAP